MKILLILDSKFKMHILFSIKIKTFVIYDYNTIAIGYKMKKFIFGNLNF